MTKKIQANLKRCPLLKITKKTIVKDDKGVPTGEELIEEELSECYRSFCMAWHEKKQCCVYFDTSSDEEDD